MSKKEEKALTTMKDEFAVQQQKAAMMGLFNDPELMDGIDTRLPQIQIVHRSHVFEFPFGDMRKSFKGIIIDVNRVNAWWEVGFDESGGGTPPNCASLDGIAPDMSCDSPQSELCADCPRNKFGSDGRGKSCKNMKRVHILIADMPLPYRLTLPPTNLKAIDQYVSDLQAQGRPYPSVVTEFTLKEMANKDGIKSSVVHLEIADDFSVGPDGEPRTSAEIIQIVQSIAHRRKDLLPLMRQQTISAAERGA